MGIRSAGLECNQVNSPGLFVQIRYFQDWIHRQFQRTDNPPPGLVTPPGVPDGTVVPDGASTIVLSTGVVILLGVINLVGLW